MSAVCPLHINPFQHPDPYKTMIKYPMRSKEEVTCTIGSRFESKHCVKNKHVSLERGLPIHWTDVTA